jgi:hypothetical protein
MANRDRQYAGSVLILRLILWLVLLLFAAIITVIVVQRV